VRLLERGLLYIPKKNGEPVGDVIRLSGRRAASRLPQQVDADTSYSYYCVLCDSDVFRLRPDGEVHCANCDKLIDNLKVSESMSGKQTG
jgi:DNA-directed RNA polymerase subunit RPC12/RpoP